MVPTLAKSSLANRAQRTSQADMTGTQRPIRARRATLATRVIAVATASALVGASLPARAQGGPGLIRDAEIEQLLKDYTQPLLKVAGLAQQNVRPVIIGDRGFNAFVADGRRIFVNAGALMESETPNQIIGVLAHETGHIAGGHLARLREQLANATTQSILAMLLGIGAMVAGGRAGNNGMSQAGAAAIAGPSQAVRHPRAAGHVGAPLPAEQHQPGRALRAGDLGLSLLRPARGDSADRRAHSRAAAEPLLPRAQGPGIARSREAGRSYRPAAP